MPGGLTKRQIQGIKKMLNYDYAKAKERKKQRRLEKAMRQRDERYKSKKQEIQEHWQMELELGGDVDADR